jgi:hypothetical protein
MEMRCAHENRLTVRNPSGFVMEAPNTPPQRRKAVHDTRRRVRLQSPDDSAQCSRRFQPYCCGSTELPMPPPCTAASWMIAAVLPFPSSASSAAS